MRLTADLARDSPAYINPLRQRELSLRGFKIPVIENLGATQDQYQVIDFSDNEILKVDNFPVMLKLEALLFADNRICRIARGLGKFLPKLETIVFTNNKFARLNDLKPLSEFPITFLCLLGNPVAKLADYRLFVIHRLPKLKVLDYQKVKKRERAIAKAKFGDLNLAGEEKEEEDTPMIGIEAAPAAGESLLTPEERAAIMEKIRTATSLSEIEQLEKQLKAPTSVHVDDAESEGEEEAEKEEEEKTLEA
jgi:U2 small nuclear ribonucleoprotein A'